MVDLSHNTSTSVVCTYKSQGIQTMAERSCKNQIKTLEALKRNKNLLWMVVWKAMVAYLNHIKMQIRKFQLSKLNIRG